MREYAQYCPVALASAVLADRWMPLIVRELVLGSRRFNTRSVELTEAGLPAQRVNIEFDYRGDDPTRIWLVLDQREASVCTEHPGFVSDVLITTEPVALMRVFSGIVTLAQATAEGSVVLTGPPRLLRALPTWFLWSPFAPAVRARQLSVRSAAP